MVRPKVRQWLSLTLALWLGAGCTEEGVLLVVDVRTDLVPAVEFSAVDTRVEHAGGIGEDTAEAMAGEDWFVGRRIFEQAGIAPGAATVVVTLRDARGEPVLSRRTLVDVEADTAATVLMTRDCVDVSCDGSDPNAGACLGQRCVPLECSVDNPDACPPPECTVDADCPAAAACAAARCVGGVCTLEPRDARCGPEEYCQPDVGCLPYDGAPCGGMEGCMEEGVLLVVDVRTDLVPAVEFSAVDTRVEHAGGIGEDTAEAMAGEDWFVGRRIFEQAGIAPGAATVVVTLRDARGEPVLSRRTLVDVEADTAVTVLMTRDCVDVSCDGGDPGAATCLGRRCVPLECSVDDPDACPPPECTVDADCPAAGACAAARCVGGVCTLEPRDARCAPEEYCQPDVGCLPAGGPCGAGPFSMPAPLSSSTDRAEYSPEISADGLTLYLSGPSSGGDNDLFVATRVSRADDFGPFTPIDELDTPSDEGDPSVSPDQLALYFRSDRDGSMRIYVATRPSRGAPFEAPTPIASLSDTEDSRDVEVSFDGLELFYRAGASGGGDGDLWVARRSSRSEPFGPPTRVNELSTPSDERAPSLSADGLTLYFSSSAAGSLDLYAATRPSRGEPFEAPTRMDLSLDGIVDDDASVTADGTELFFSSNRAGTAGPFDVWTATRGCP